MESQSHSSEQFTGLSRSVRHWMLRFLVNHPLCSAASCQSLIKYCVIVATLIYEYTCAQIGEEVSSSCNPSPHRSPLTISAISNEPETFHSCEAGFCAPSLDEKEGSRKKLHTPRENRNSPIASKNSTI